MSSRSAKSYHEARMAGRALTSGVGGMYSDGEVTNGTPGTMFTAVITERQNKSLSRNAGPDHVSANTGVLPFVTNADRKTGRV